MLTIDLGASTTDLTVVRSSAEGELKSKSRDQQMLEKSIQSKEQQRLWLAFGRRANSKRTRDI